MYGKCGRIGDAKLVFDSIRQPNRCSWTILIGAFAHNGDLLRLKQTFDLAPFRSLAAFKASITAFSNHGVTPQAHGFSDKMPLRHLIAWNAFLQAFAWGGQVKALFDRMNDQLLDGLRESRPGVHIPARATSARPPPFFTASHSGRPPRVRRCRVDILQRDVYSWNSLITAFAHHGDLHGAGCVFKKLSARNTVYNLMLTAGGEAGDVQQCETIFQTMPETATVSLNSVLQAYSKNGQLQKLHELGMSSPGTQYSMTTIR